LIFIHLQLILIIESVIEFFSYSHLYLSCEVRSPKHATKESRTAWVRRSSESALSCSSVGTARGRIPGGRSWQGGIEDFFR